MRGQWPFCLRTFLFPHVVHLALFDLGENALSRNTMRLFSVSKTSVTGVEGISASYTSRHWGPGGSYLLGGGFILVKNTEGFWFYSG